jgi:O-antigen/teichoic acid export membrane protein
VLQTVASFYGALLSRDLRFGSLARSELASVSAQLLLTVVLALAGAGVWALVGAAAGAQLARTAALRVAARWHALRPADYSRCRDHAALAANLTGSRLLFYGYTRFDLFVLSRWAAKGMLAAYYNAFRLAAIPAMIVSTALQQVAFSGLAAAKHDVEELRLRFLAVTRYAAMTAAPAAVGLWVVADDAVAVIYGPGWGDTVYLLKVLAFAGMAHSLQIAGPSLFLAVGRTDRNMVVSLVNAIVLIPAMLVSVRWGAQGVALTWLVLGTLLDLAVLLLAARTIGLGLSATAAVVWPSVFRAVGMGAVTFGVGRLSLVSSLPAPLRLSLLVMIGATVYVGWTAWRDRDVRAWFAAARRRVRFASAPVPRGTGLDT